MAHAALADRWAKGRAALGGWLTSASEATIQIYGRAGYDYVGIDTQHTVLSEADAAALVQRIPSAPFAVLVRVSKNDPSLIGRILDAGADGVIVPMVNTADECAVAIASCRYPPEGVRSFGPMRTDLGLDLRSLEERVSCFVMIETLQGLDNAEEICAVPGLAGVYLGPADLSIGLGLDPMRAFSSDQLREPVEAIGAACTKFDRVLAAHALNATDATRWLARGCRMVSLGAESVMLATIAAQELARARAADTGEEEGHASPG